MVMSKMQLRFREHSNQQVSVRENIKKQDRATIGEVGTVRTPFPQEMSKAK